MRFKNINTGDVMEVPPPDALGNSVVRFNGRVVERVTYSDADESATLSDVRVFHGDEWPEYLIKQMETGGWNVIQ